MDCFSCVTPSKHALAVRFVKEHQCAPLLYIELSLTYNEKIRKDLTGKIRKDIHPLLFTLDHYYREKMLSYQLLPLASTVSSIVSS